MRRSLAILVLPLVATCSMPTTPTTPTTKATDPSTAPDLESAAIAAGVIADPANTDITGLFARDTDRVCLVPDRLNYRIGVFVDYGDQQQCSGTGSVSRVGETLHIDFKSAPGCDFEARFEGDRILFPGKLPEACEKLCSRRASMAALDVRRLSDSVSEASTLRDAKGRMLCTVGG